MRFDQQLNNALNFVAKILASWHDHNYKHGRSYIYIKFTNASQTLTPNDILIFDIKLNYTIHSRYRDIFRFKMINF